MYQGRGRRVALVTGAMLMALGWAGGASTSSADPAVEADAHAGTQDGPVDGLFPGYVGVAAEGASTAAGTDDASSKPADAGPVGANAPGSVDVPGEAGAAESPADPATTIVPPSAAQGDSPEVLRSELAATGSLRVIVTTTLPVEVEAHLAPQAVGQQRRAIGASLNEVAAALAGTGSQVVTRFEVVPAAVAVVDAAGLDALLAHPAVASVTIDREAPLALAVSTGVIDSDLLNTAGVLGNNYEGSPGGRYEVAIVDTGVDNGHNAFIGRIVAQACFSATSFCPNGTTTQIGGNAGDDCTYSTQCDHGTHVGGIAAGSFYTGGHEGVARGAGIVAIQVGHRSTHCVPGEPFPCWRYFFSDLDRALQHTLNLRNAGRNIAAVNMSLGGPLFSDSSSCGASFPNTQNLAANLQAAGVAFVAAAGNNGSTTQTTYPGCLPSAYTIGATDNSDVPAGFTNSSVSLDWWAPGVGITAPVPTADNKGSKSGTSMSTPHVTGAFALLRECVDGNGVGITTSRIATLLSSNGPNVTRAGITRRRINVLDSATATVNNNDFAFAETIPPGGLDDFDFNVCADAEPGEPGPFSLDNSIWWNWTPSVTGTATISTEDGGGHVTTFDTTLTVYTGSTLTGLTVIAADDDSGTGLRSLVVFPVNGGTTYRIKVDGFAATNGLMNLHVANGPPPTCQGAPATIVGTTGNDTINGTPGNDVIVAGDGNDTVLSGDGADRVCGGVGDDTITTGTGNDLVFGGPGADRIFGETGDDTLVGNAGGGDTNDVGDIINGGPNNDTLDGWVGDDRLQGGNDDDFIIGAAGIDTATYENAVNGVSVDLTAGTAIGQGSDSFSEVENVIGSPFGDVLVGNAVANALSGGSGSDILDGADGDDRLTGGGGNDTMYGRAGNDQYIGSGGLDTARFDNAPVGVSVDLTAGTATGDGADTLFPDVENLVGSAFADTLIGNGVRNVVDGAASNDFIRGRSGNDQLVGGFGNDNIRGEIGIDTVDGGDGIDDVRGGDGNDSVLGGAGNDVVFGDAGDDALNGGAGTDSCDGGTGTDTGTSCETQIGIP